MLVELVQLELLATPTKTPEPDLGLHHDRLTRDVCMLLRTQWSDRQVDRSPDEICKSVNQPLLHSGVCKATQTTTTPTVTVRE